jgi:hypothetical protein
MVAVACGFAASTPIQAQQDDARLAVSRSANFGTFQYLILFVDGVHVADLGVNQSYEAMLPPGQHVLSVSTTPQIYRYTAPTQRRVNAEPGKTYAFTAFWKNFDEAYIEKNGSSKRIITPSSPG